MWCQLYIEDRVYKASQSAHSTILWSLLTLCSAQDRSCFPVVVRLLSTISTEPFQPSKYAIDWPPIAQCAWIMAYYAKSNNCSNGNILFRGIKTQHLYNTFNGIRLMQWYKSIFISSATEYRLTVVNALHLSIVINEYIQSVETIISSSYGSRRQNSMVRGEVLYSYNLQISQCE